MTYELWQQDDIPVMDIDLDELNPRIPGHGLAQRELIDDLIANAKVIELARAIAQKGYYPTERIIVRRASSKRYVVLEGNRRVAALKLLLSPSLAPETSRSRIEKIANTLTDDQKESFSEIAAVIAPSREAANPIIADRHTSPPVESWRPIMQARFFYNMLEEQSPKSITAEFKITPGDLARFVRQAEMYQIACTLDLPSETQQIVRNERKFPITSLERIYMNPRARELLGIHFNDDGRVIGRVKKDEFAHGYKRILSDIAHDRSDSRELDTAPDIEKYMQGIAKYLPNTSVPGRFNIKTFIPTSKLPAPTSKQQRKQRAAPPRTSRTFIPPNTKCTLTQQKIQRIYKELRQMPVGRFPSAAAVLFRSFLQMSLAIYVKEHGEISKVKARNVGAPTLGELMEHLGDQKNPLLPDKSLRAVLRKAKSQKDMITSLDTMNAFAHNEALIVTEKSARDTWAFFEPLMEVILLKNAKD